MVARLAKSQEEAQYIRKAVGYRLSLLEHLEFDAGLLIERGIEGHLLLIEFQHLCLNLSRWEIHNPRTVDGLRLCPPQEERFQYRLQQADGVLVALLVGLLDHLIPPREVTKRIQFEEMQQTEHVVQFVLDGSCRETPLPICMQGIASLGLNICYSNYTSKRE